MQAQIHRIPVGLAGLMIIVLLVGCASFSSKSYISEPSRQPSSVSFGADPKSCTIFTVKHGERAFFGNNEDHYGLNVVLSFYPAEGKNFGSIRVGYQGKDGSNDYEGVMNDHGLAWDINSIPAAPLNPPVGIPESNGLREYLSRLTLRVSTVKQAIALTRLYNFGNSLAGNLHIADASGDAVIISPGPDGQLAFTRKTSGDGYLVSTNFNPAIPGSANAPESYDRFNAASSLLEQAVAAGDLSVERLSGVLKDVHFEGPSTYTLYSNLFDLHNQVIYLYYLSDYTEVVRFDLKEELSEGEQHFRIEDLVSSQTRRQALARYRLILARDFLLLGLLLGSLSIGFGTLVVLLVGWVRQRSSPQTGSSTASTWRYGILFGLAWTCAFWGVPVLVSIIYPPAIMNSLGLESMLSKALFFVLPGLLGLVLVGISLRKLRAHTPVASTDEVKTTRLNWLPSILTLTSVLALLYIGARLVWLLRQILI